MPEDSTAGERLRRRVQADLDHNRVMLTGVEEELLDRAVGIADSIEQLEAVIAAEGPTTKGNRGTITHPALTEVRHLSLALHRILTSIDAEGTKDAAADAKAQRARSTAWTGRRGNAHG
jgi:hypothetical protein